MTPSKYLVEAVTRGRQPSQCDCHECQAMCQRSPCLGTPEDILRLIEIGHAGKLRRTLWMAVEGAPEIEMVQLSGGEMRADGSQTCCMFDGEHCTIHADKPTEGVLAGHAPCHIIQSPTLAVALTWLLPENRALVAEIFNRIP